LNLSSTSIFRASLHELCRRPKYQYTSCPCDICAELLNKSVEELLTTNNAVLHDDGVKCIVKIRLPCASRNVGKSGGFRLIAVGNRQEQLLVMLDIYPKTGTRGKANITGSELAALLKTFLKERDANELARHDLSNELVVIPKENL